MRKRYFSSVNLKEKKVDVDVKNNQKKFIANGNCFTVLANTNMPVAEIFTAGERTFFQCVNGQILEYSDGNVIDKMQYLNVSSIFAIENGNVFVFNGEECYDIDTGKPYEIPFGKVKVAFGRLFSARGNVIKMSAFNNLTDFSEGEYIKTDNADGDILSLQFLDEKFYIFTKKAIYLLTQVENLVEFNLKKLVLPDIEIIDKTVQSLGDRIVFLTNERVCTLKDDKITFTDFTVDEERVNKSCVHDGKYTLLINGDTYFYDFIDDKKQVYNLGDYTIRGEYAVSNLDTGVYLFDRENVSEKASLYFDFGSAYKKALTEISMSSETPVKLTLQGDFGKRNYLFNKENKVKKLNLTSTAFKLEYVCETADGVKNLKLKYTLNGGD